MKKGFRWKTVAGLAAAAWALACAPAAAQAGASPGAPPHTEADARFMREMIGHHAQALEMTSLVPERTQRADLRLLAERISVSQQDEIALMRQWLRERGEAAPDTAAHGGHGAHGHEGHGGHDAHAAMPGMASPEEMARLAAARGAEFERLFLELMIRHHEGALTMVAQLFATPGAAQDASTYQFAADVDADQRMEIDRMRALQGGALQR